MVSKDWLYQKYTSIKLFLFYLLQRFKENKLNQSAAILAYTTLLSLVPFLAVCFSLITAFPVFKNVQGDIRELIISNFVATSRDVIQQYIDTFVNKTSNLTAVGICGVIVTALLMMSTIDRAMNKIWRVKATRHKVYEFVIYWAVLTLGPLLIGVSFVVTSYLFSLPLLSDSSVGSSKSFLLRLLPFFFEMVAFALMYIVLPNRRVKFFHAFSGAAIAALLFEIAKKIFALFVANFTSYQAIYGAMAAIPIFLLWIYLSWIIVLFGAEFAHGLGSYRDGVLNKLSDPSMLFVLSVRIIGHLWISQKSGNSLGRNDLMKVEPSIDEDSLRKVLEILEKQNIIAFTSSSKWVLVRDITEFSLLDLYRSHVFPLPSVNEAWSERDQWNRSVADKLQLIDNDLDTKFNIPLSAIYIESDVGK